MKFTPIAEIGEFNLIENIKKNTEIKHASSKITIGDDAASTEISNDEVLLLSTDMLVNDIHFDLSFHPLQHLGYKSVVVSLSDIAAMNAIPTHITMAVGLSSRFSVEAVEELYQGIHNACKNYNVDLVGGDTTGSHQGLLITSTAWGIAQKKRVVKREGAKKGDILCVSGNLGGAYTGLQILLREKKKFLDYNKQSKKNFKPDLENDTAVLQKYLKPEARTDIVKELKNKGVLPHAMIDISDGLGSEIIHICKASQVGVRIYESKLPLKDSSIAIKKNKFDFSALDAVMRGGEEYELLFSLSKEDFEKIRNNVNITPIGHILEDEKYELVEASNKISIIEPDGWKHF